MVAEVSTQLAGDGRRGVSAELGLLRQVEALDRLEQCEKGHLLEVVAVQAPPGVAVGERPRERHVRHRHELERVVPLGLVGRGAKGLDELSSAIVGPLGDERAQT